MSLALSAGIIAAMGIGSVVRAATIDLPPVTELSSQFTFKTTQILDRNGKLLYELNDKDGGRRLPVPLAEVSPVLADATIATEDKDFYANSGVDPVGIARAVFQNTVTGQLSQGASTITQQLAKNELIQTENRTDKTWTRKVQEAILAFRISQRYSKDEILEMYLNSVYYGHLSYGIEAAAQTYFGRHAKDLNLAEASLLAGLPQAPSDYDPFIHLSSAKDRQTHVLDRMVAEGYITQDEAGAAKTAPLQLQAGNEEPFRAPHFVMYVRQLLEQKYGSDLVYNGGLRVTTTLDLNKYDLAMNAVRTNLDALKKQDANNAGLVSIDPKTGQILVMLGSKDYFDNSIDGQVNMATSPRSPGSTIKPLEYALAFSKGWGPETITLDEPTEFPNAQPYLPNYAPHNFDFKFDGPMTVRFALSNSKNIPAIKALMYDGIPDFLKFLGNLGIQLDNPDVYGLALGLGNAPVSVLNMVGAYSAIANGGVYHKPVAILKVEDWQGNVLEEYQPTQGEQVIGAVQAYEISSILSDNWARTPLQGPNSPLRLTRPAAAKTGSTDDYKDSWQIGFTPDLVTGVWVGNTNNKPMKEVLGSLGAGHIWHTFMEDAHVGMPVHDFTPPPGVREYRICKATGGPVTPDCDQVLQEVYPLTYTPAPYAIIPGLSDIANNKTAASRARQGGVLGQTVSPDGIPMQPKEKDKPW
ncbi:MAG TPA: PBP1A family penicillin-binding protein [Chloroflexota bacterium]